MQNAKGFKKQTLSLLATLGVSTLGIACAATADGQAIESNHTAGVLVARNSPFLWNDVHPTINWSESAAVNPDDQAITTRLQLWVDRMDEVVRAKYLAQHGTALVAPKPQVRIQHASEMLNAWVSYIDTCTGRPFGTTTADLVARPVGGLTTFSGSTLGSMVVSEPGNATCQNPP